MQTHITPAHLREWDARYSDEAIAAIYGGRESLTPLEILSLDIPAEDRLWVVLRPEVLGERNLRLAACDFADRVLPIYEARVPGDDRPRRAIEIARRFDRGEATREELDAARAAAWHAAWTNTEATAVAASWAATAATRAALVALADLDALAAAEAADAASWAAANAAAWAAGMLDAAEDAERLAQVAIVRGYLERARVGDDACTEPQRR